MKSTLAKDLAASYFIATVDSNDGNTYTDTSNDTLLQEPILLAYSFAIIAMKLIEAPNDVKEVILTRRDRNTFGLRAEDIQHAEIIIMTKLRFQIKWSQASYFKLKLSEFRICSRSSNVERKTRSTSVESNRIALWNYIDDAFTIYLGLNQFGQSVEPLIKFTAIALVTTSIEKFLNNSDEIVKENILTPSSSKNRYIPLPNYPPTPQGIELFKDFTDNIRVIVASPAKATRKIQDEMRYIDSTALVMTLLSIDFHYQKDPANYSCQYALNVISMIFKTLIQRIEDEDEDDQIDYNIRNTLIDRVKCLPISQLNDIQLTANLSIFSAFSKWTRYKDITIKN